MADTIVKSFVIDTSQAEQNLRSLDAATIVTKNSLDALYNQLVQLDAQLNGLDPNSEAFANVNTQIQALEATISNIETGGIENIGTALNSIDAAKVQEVGNAIQGIDTSNVVTDINNINNALSSIDASEAAAQVDSVTAAIDAVDTTNIVGDIANINTELNNIDATSVATDINEITSAIGSIDASNAVSQIGSIDGALTSIDTSAVVSEINNVSEAVSDINTNNITNVGSAVESVVAPVNQLSSATGQLNDELKETKVDTSNLDTAASEYKDLAVTQEEVVTSSKSLKAQLRELQAQLAATDPDSAKYRELSQAAGELKDRIQDAAQAVGTQAGGAFERVGGSLGLVTSRIANLDFTGAAEGAKQLAANIGQVKPGDIAKGISSIGSAFVSVGKALLTNPIFLIGAAIAAAIVYADELLSLIDGVTDAEQEALNVQKERAAAAKQSYDNISATEETLKRQGLTEKQITDLKLTQLNTAIAEQQAVVQTTRIQAEGQIKAAERNALYLKTFLDFVTLPQKKIAEFFQSFVNGSIEVLNKLGLGIEKIDVVSVFDDVNNFIVKKIFDPEEERKNQEKIVADATKSLETLVNTRDGILNAQAAKEKAAADKRAADAKTAADAQLKAAQELAAAEEALFDELLQSFEDNEKAMTEVALKEKQKQLDAATTFYNKLAALSDSQFEASLTATEKEELAVTQKYEDLFASAEAYNATLKAGEQGNAIDIVALQKQLASELLAIQQKSAKDEGDVQDQSSQQSAERAQQVYQAKLQFISDGFATIANLADAFGKGDEARAKKAFKIQKAASVAQATVDTYKAAQGIFANAALNPKTILFPAQPYIEAALAVAAGLVNVKKISSQQFQSSGTPPSSPPPSGGGGGGGGESQPAQFNPLASQFIQDRPEQVTPRAFVLAGDVASQQEVREKVQDLARLG